MAKKVGDLIVVKGKFRNTQSQSVHTTLELFERDAYLNDAVLEVVKDYEMVKRKRTTYTCHEVIEVRIFCQKKGETKIFGYDTAFVDATKFRVVGNVNSLNQTRGD